MAELELVDPEDLRQPDAPGRQDLRGFQFRAKYWNDDTSTVLAWSSSTGTVFHERHCSHYSRTEEPIALCRMDRVREVFETERTKGTVRWFGFCAHCLTESIPYYGWKPTERDEQTWRNVRQLLRDVRVLGEPPITGQDILNRLRRLDGTTLTSRELDQLLDYYERNDPEWDDLREHVVL